MREILVLFACVMGVLVQDAASQAPAPVPPNSIFYTGQLDGFEGALPTCASADCEVLLQRAIQDVSKQKEKTAGSILVGLGDNFAPDPGTNFQTQTSAGQRTNPKFSVAQFRVMGFLSGAKYDAVVPGVQDFYFGAEFVRKSEEQVRMLAANVVRTPIQPSTCPAYPQLPAVTILLPNQVSSSIQSGSSSGAAGSGSSGGGKGKKGGGKGGGASSAAGGTTGAGSGGAGSTGAASCLPAQDTELHKASDPEYPAPKILWPDANSIYPWTSMIGFADPVPGKVTGLYLCTPEGKPLSPTLDLKTCTENLIGPKKGTSVSSLRFPIDLNDLGVKRDGSIKPNTSPTNFQLLAGAEGRICYTHPVDSNGIDHSCAKITVQDPMFTHVWSAPENTKYLILGALAPDTLNGLSSIDTSWYKDETAKDVGRQVTVNDPTSAIVQALNAFDKLNSGADGKYVILLAQMPPSEAKALADSLGEIQSWTPTRINGIFSAADLVESSPKLSVTINDPTQQAAHSESTYFIPVFTPAPVFKLMDCLRTTDETDTKRERKATQCIAHVSPKTILKSDANPEQVVSLENVPSEVNARQSTQSHELAWKSPFCADQEPSDVTKTWECGLLERILEDTSANPHLGNSSDIAILEEKDFDFPRSSWDGSSSPVQARAAEILWKSGRLVRVSLLGQTIQTLLQQNVKMQTRSFQVLGSVRSLQQLKVLGVKKIGQDYYVNGMKLSMSQMYSVATTDRLANTTSDYAQLAQVDLDNPNLFPLRGGTVEISEIAPPPQKVSPMPVNPPKPQYAHLYAARDLEAPEMLTQTPKQKSPSPQPPTFSYSNRTLVTKSDPCSSQYPCPAGSDQARQLRPLFRATLAQSALSYSSATPNQSDPSIASNFGGVTNPNVSAAYSKSVSALQNARLEWYPRNARRFAFEDMGLDYILNFAQNTQGSLAQPSATPNMTTSGAPVPERVKSLTSNSITLSPFFEFQLPKLPVWKIVTLRAITSDNVAQPLPQYLSGCTAGTSLTFQYNGATVSETCEPAATKDEFQFSLRRTWSLGYSVGTRYEKDDFNYVELGFTHQRSHDVLSALGASNVSYFCSLTGAQSLTVCAGNMPAVSGASLVPSYSSYSQNGGYLLLLVTRPVMKRFVLQESGFGNFFAYGNKDQSVLTHYAFNNMVTALINLPANFGVGPTWNQFFFQANANKSIGSSLIRRTLGAQLNYSFDWHTGVSLREFQGNSQ